MIGLRDESGSGLRSLGEAGRRVGIVSNSSPSGLSGRFTRRAGLALRSFQRSGERSMGEGLKVAKKVAKVWRFGVLHENKGKTDILP